MEPLTLGSLPLFPLGTVLFPGGVLPLRIFEVRYLDMVRKCHKHGAPFGVVALHRGSEVQRPADDGPQGAGFAPEAFDTLGTLARIERLEAPQPGLLVIRCIGTQRFRVERSEKLRHGLWIGDVTCLPPEAAVAVPADLRPVADALGRLIQSLQERGANVADLPLQAPWQLEDCGWVANRWCELLQMPLSTKQRLMALDNPLMRLELVGDLLERSGIVE